MARALRRLSPRKNIEFIPMNGNALAENVLKSELFGRVKRPFTGAISTQHGLFKLVSGGTFFFCRIPKPSKRDFLGPEDTLLMKYKKR